MLYVRLLFGVPLPVEDWVAFVVAVPPTILAIGMLGFLLGAAFVRFRSAWSVGNLFEFPVWTVCGLLVPIAVLPAWIEPVSWVLRPDLGHERATRRGARPGARRGTTSPCASRCPSRTACRAHSRSCASSVPLRARAARWR